MEQAKLIGVGCIGRPDRVARLLGKIMKNTRSSYVIPSEAESENDRLSASGSTTGFYIGYDDRGLSLSFYSPNLDGHAGRCNVYRLEHNNEGLH